jgi:probable HAF family extracellular repeat protein
LLVVATTSASAQTLVVTPLDFPGAILTNAQGINAQGEIVGFYTDAAGRTHGFVQSGGTSDQSTSQALSSRGSAGSGQQEISAAITSDKASQEAFPATATC